ncbi:metal ABC transporter ATP-binding protein [Candidatus Endolissoclinum faulkneri]|uniref:metal ABC transporter ATP-binding protein n=1 Tax=Candidatus Endolissoclinum faulkneri TaxID=1263979 RepID=UPI0005C53C2D|nr:ABC transporter ATP-binding protein [Candidatus Endolissoclinum faulkneri]
MNHSGIYLHKVSIAYDRQLVIDDLSGAFEFGTMTAITGPNGAGKSTLIKTIMGELLPDSGKIDLGGISNSTLGYLPQSLTIDRSFPISVIDTVILGTWPRIGPFSGVTSEMEYEATDALSAVGLSGFGRRSICTLSAGQFQRVLFARLLLQDPKIILLDEPFNLIDNRTTQDLLSIIVRWHDEKRTIIIILHDFEQIRAHFPNTLLLARKSIAWGPTENTLSSANLLSAQSIADGWSKEPKLYSKLLEI